MKLFELFATLSLDTSDFDSGSEQALQRADELGTKIGHAIANVLNGAEKAGKWLADNAETIWDWGKSAVETAAEIRAANARYTRLFGDMADEASESFNRVSDSTGLLAGMLRGVGSDAFDLFVGAGMDAADALVQMELYMQLAADAAAAYDMSLADSHDHLLSFLRGNTEAGEAIHINITSATKDAKALELYNKKWKELTETEKQYVLLDIAKETYMRTSVWGSAKAEAGEYAATLDTLKYKLRQALGALGDPLLDAVVPVLERITKWFEDNPETVKAFGEAIGVIADRLATALIDLIDWIGQHSAEITGFIDGVGSVLSFFFGGNKKKKEPMWTKEEAKLIDDYIEAQRIWVEAGRPMRSTIGITDEQKRALRNYNKASDVLMDRGLFVKYVEYAEIAGVDPHLQQPIPAEYIIPDDAEADMQADIDNMSLEVPVTPVVAEQESGFMQFLRGIPAALGFPSHATGLDYVPYNDYTARLHEGEAVLTKAEAEAWRRHGVGGGGAPAIDYNLMAEAMLTAFSGVSLQMDKRVVGGLVGPTVSRDIARGARNRRYTG